MTATPGWYPDPAGSGCLRFYDGTCWTPHLAWPEPALPRWKGARLGRPPIGPGALAHPQRRLAARLLDALILLPVPIVLLVLAFAGLARWLSGRSTSSSDQPIAAIIGFELSILGLVAVVGMLGMLYEALTTTRYGRTPGKAIMRIRPVRLDGTALSAGRSFARAGAVYAAALVQVVQLLDVLWCLWDDDAQCLHDKVCETLVVSDD